VGHASFFDCLYVKIPDHRVLIPASIQSSQLWRLGLGCNIVLNRGAMRNTSRLNESGSALQLQDSCEKGARKTAWAQTHQKIRKNLTHPVG